MDIVRIRITERRDRLTLEAQSCAYCHDDVPVGTLSGDHAITTTTDGTPIPHSAACASCRAEHYRARAAKAHADMTCAMATLRAAVAATERAWADVRATIGGGR